MMGIKLNAHWQAIIIKNLQSLLNMPVHEKSLDSLPPTGARRRMELEYQDWARLQGRGPSHHTRADASTALCQWGGGRRGRV